MDVYRIIQDRVYDENHLMSPLTTVRAIADAAWSYFDQKFGYVRQISREMYEDQPVFESWSDDALRTLCHAIMDEGLLPIELPVITKTFYGADESGVLDVINPIPESEIEQGHPWMVVEIRYRVRCRQPVTS